MLRKLNFNDGLVKAEWQDLYCRNHHLLPYASREYNELFNKYFRLDSKRLFMQKRFYGLYDGDERLHLNSSAFRSIKKNGFAVFESSSVSSGIGGTYVSLPGYFSVQASLSPDSLYRFFPPLARESGVSGIIFSDISSTCFRKASINP